MKMWMIHAATSRMTMTMKISHAASIHDNTTLHDSTHQQPAWLSHIAMTVTMMRIQGEYDDGDVDDEVDDEIEDDVDDDNDDD